MPPIYTEAVFYYFSLIPRRFTYRNGRNANVIEVDTGYQEVKNYNLIQTTNANGARKHGIYLRKADDKERVLKPRKQMVKKDRIERVLLEGCWAASSRM